MSDFYNMSRSEQKGGLSVYLVDDIASGSSIDKATALLAGIPHGVEKAVGSAIKRAAQSGMTYASKAIRQEYHVRDADFKRYTKSKRHISTKSGETEVDITFMGWHIPLLKFDVSAGKDGRVKAKVKRSSSKVAFDNAFVARMSKYGHEGIFERVSERRLPVREIFGPSTPQMMDYNDDVSQAIGDKVRDTFEERIDHEITAVLNGWRR